MFKAVNFLSPVTECKLEVAVVTVTQSVKAFVIYYFVCIISATLFNCCFANLTAFGLDACFERRYRLLFLSRFFFLKPKFDLSHAFVSLAKSSAYQHSVCVRMAAYVCDCVFVFAEPV